MSSKTTAPHSDVHPYGVNLWGDLIPPHGKGQGRQQNDEILGEAHDHITNVVISLVL